MLGLKLNHVSKRGHRNVSTYGVSRLQWVHFFIELHHSSERRCVVCLSISMRITSVTLVPSHNKTRAVLIFSGGTYLVFLWLLLHWLQSDNIRIHMHRFQIPVNIWFPFWHIQIESMTIVKIHVHYHYDPLQNYSHKYVIFMTNVFHKLIKI